MPNDNESMVTAAAVVFSPSALLDLDHHHHLDPNVNVNVAAVPALPPSTFSSIIARRPTMAPTTLMLRPHISTTTHFHRRPTWMQLTAGSNKNEPSRIPLPMSEDHNMNGTSTNDYSSSPIESDLQLLAPIFSSPRAASTAYQCGLLKSSTPSIAVTSKYYRDWHSSMRLAFRYATAMTTTRKKQTIASSKNGDDDDDDNDDDLFLCWIDEHGIPFHFRKLRPNIAADRRTINDDNDNDARQNGTDTTTSTIPMVNESDHIEKTFPGHAFVLCRKVTNNNLGGVANNNDDDGNVLKVDAVREGGNDTSIAVVHKDGMTYFLRKKRREKKSRGCNNEDCYLVVGGFRPGPTPPVRQKNDKKEEEERNDSDGDDDDDDDDDMYVQLVTITQQSSRTNATADDGMLQARSSITKSYQHSAASHKRIDFDDDDEHEHEHEHEDSPTASWKTLCCACFPGMASPRSRRTPAFLVASAISQADLATSSLSQLLPRLPIHGNPRTTAKNTEDDGECILDITVTLSRLDPTPIDTSSKHYDTILLGDWPCRIEPGCFPSNMTNPITGKNALQCRFESDILAASASLPPHARERLKKSTPIWINKSSCYGPKVSPIVDRDACFHPGTEWLIKNGMNPAKCGGVEWYNAQHYLCDCDLWGPGGQVLHELSHAWHCLHIEGGYDNEEIINVFNLAMEEGLYECVRVHDLHGKTKECKAYACNNPMEYFAELSVAFLGGLDNDAEHNKWYPFNRRQLREHDPRAFDLLCRMWGVVVDEDKS